MTRSTTFSILPLPLAGSFVIEPPTHRDARGSFVKTFHARALAVEGLSFELREEFYSVSQKGVLRGMHFQTPPYEHRKLVSCIAGRVLDVLVDLRRGSPTYGRHCSIELNADRPQVIWIPAGLAHGFLSLEDDSCVTYKTDCEHAPDHDAGVRWDTFGFAWPMPADDMIISPRDQQHPPLSDFVSPFCDLVAAGG